jgi:hypothetical protein
MLFNAGGLQLMGWLTGSEIYPLAVRGAGTSAQSAALWTTNLVSTLGLQSCCAPPPPSCPGRPCSLASPLRTNRSRTPWEQ